VDLGEELGCCSAGLASRLHVHEEGFAVSRRLGRDHRHHYAEVRELINDRGIRFTWDSERGSVLSTPYWHPRLTMTNGSTVRMRLQGATTRTLARDFVHYGIRSDSEPSPAGEMLGLLQERVGQAQLPAALETVGSGGAVAFGPFTVTRAHLHHHTAGVLAWDRFDDFERSATYATILPPVSTGASCTAFQWFDPPTTGRYHGEPYPRRWAAAPLAEVPNTETLVLLAKTIKTNNGPSQ
jgi:hypothetical protein